ncbi:MAG: obg [Acidimicrobiaceae bacterium]|nr:MAG: obg [Acidimicrobiaceae bacterium]
MSGFVDEAQLNVRGGDGGAGCVSFRREGPVAFGGPNGGDGGKGGDVWLVADRNVSSLLAFRDHPHRRAVDGVHGKGKDQHGRRGDALEVAVPEGTVAHDMYTGELLADLANHGDKWLAAHGGRGGRGNAKFWSNKRRAPGFAEQGEHGEDRWLKLELKLMADVALVGFPNVGKSTLISVISAARPKIADYPFTTLEPNLGVVSVDQDTNFVVADIPGLIEGASEGKGLGHQFLRHIERARVLCVMVDLAPLDGVGPHDQQRILLEELGAYRPELLDRPRLVVGSKVDMATNAWDGPDWNGESVSSITHQGVKELVGRMAALVHEARQEQPVVEGLVIIRPEAEGSRVERVGEHEFRLSGRQVERVVALNDVTTPEALSFIDHQLERLHIPRMLARAGATDGDIVWIAGFSFEYQQDI